MGQKELEYKMIFVASCIEAVVRKLNSTTEEIYRRMKTVNLIEGFHNPDDYLFLISDIYIVDEAIFELQGLR